MKVFEISYFWNGGFKVAEIPASSKKDAMQDLRDTIPGCKIISCRKVREFDLPGSKK